MNHKYILVSLFIALLLWASCKKDTTTDNGGNNWKYNPTYISLPTPEGFPPMNLPQDNLLTEQGVKLGRMLFYDPILSGDSTLACAGCHNQAYGFTDDDKQFSTGIDGVQGNRNAMPIFNMAYGAAFFWDGRAATLADQAQQPVTNPVEMHAEWSDNIKKLQNSSFYPKLFYEAFGIQPEEITQEYAGKAIEQFELTIISDNSKYDKDRRLETQGHPELELTDLELEGMNLFIDSEGGDCFHCHGDPFGGNVQLQELNPAQQFRNNGLDAAQTTADFVDPGLGGITGNPDDYGKFKVPSLRNVELTAPYMHDGRFQTLEEVLDFYSDGVHDTPFTDPNMQFAYQGGAHLTAHEKEAIIAFLKTLTDHEYANNPAYSNPFE